MDINSLFDLSGKVAIVTGGGDGIGAGCSKILAAAGASVVVSDISADKAKAVADEITASGGKAMSVACNVLEDADLVNLVDTAVKTYGTVNILVNNAGLGGGGRENPFRIDTDYVKRIYSINVFAPWRLCQLSVPEMEKSGYGSIVNITSMSSVDKEPDMCVYASSKAALNHLAANLAPRSDMRVSQKKICRPSPAMPATTSTTCPTTRLLPTSTPPATSSAIGNPASSGGPSRVPTSTATPTSPIPKDTKIVNS